MTSRWLVRACGIGSLTLFVILTAACGGSSLPGGVYTSQQYHFKVTYPAGWQANVQQQSDAPAPLIVIITRSGAHSNAALISSLTIDVLNLSDIGGAKVATQLAQNKSLTPITLSGLTAYQDQPSQQQGAGNESAVTVTHTDYFLVHDAYEYQLSIDAFPGDTAALNSMAQSFTII